jgi:hypothetical protein
MANKDTDPFGFSEGAKIAFGADPSGDGYLFRIPQEVHLSNSIERN